MLYSYYVPHYYIVLCIVFILFILLWHSNYDPFYVKDKSSLNSSFNQQLHRGSISAIIMFTLKIMQRIFKNIIIITILLS